MNRLAPTSSVIEIAELRHHQRAPEAAMAAAANLLERGIDVASSGIEAGSKPSQDAGQQARRRR